MSVLPEAKAGSEMAWKGLALLPSPPGRPIGGT